MIAWLAFIATLSVIILVHEWGHFVMARRIGVRVERFSFGFGPRLLRWRRGGTEYALSLLPFGGYVKLAGESGEEPGPSRPWEYRSRSVRERMAIVAAGPVINYALGFLLFFGVFLVGATVFTTQVGRVQAGYPAAEAGLKELDRVLAVNGRPVEDWSDMTRAIQAQTESVALTIEREGKRLERLLRPKVLERAGLFGARIRTGVIGISPSGETRVQRYPAPQALAKAGYQLWFLTAETVRSFWAIAVGARSIQESFAGPVRIFDITSAVAAQGVVSLLQWVALLSTCIGFFNLLPIPVLDGGHLAFLAVEWLRKQPVSGRIQERMTQVGLTLLVLLLAVVTYNDLVSMDLFGRLRGLFR